MKSSFRRNPGYRRHRGKRRNPLTFTIIIIVLPNNNNLTNTNTSKQYFPNSNINFKLCIFLGTNNKYLPDNTFDGI